MESHNVRNTTFWKDFFRLYRSMPELWLTTSKDYRNRKLKTQSYELLLKHMRTFDPSANIHMLKRKINNLRTSYRRELRKVLDNKSALRGGLDEYRPSLWYFNELEFLYDLETGEAQTLIEPLHVAREPQQEQHAYFKQADNQDVAEVSPGVPTPDEELFTKLFQPGDDMLVSEGDGDVEGVADADADDAGLDGEVEYETVNETRHKLDLKMESKYQQQHSTSNNHNNNNNNNNSSSSRISAGKQSRLHPYQSGQQQQQLQAQSTSLRRSIALPQMQRRRRRSSTNDGDGDVDIDIDIDEDNNNNNSSSRSSAIAAAGKKRRRQMMLMEQQSALQSEQTESECDLIGKRMAAHFRNMRPDQRLFAERIISEVLVFGRMNRLSLSARFLPNGDVGDVYAI
ncbi:uncharacterized protein LOC6565146 isoform X1 [Drosophila grimshawi]|uniref:GH12134 n=1 Tax=Drosophila grimshawi TaxID=7222 RepID=B4JK16_DROGR|nr:uncharacterized protein LOC6565146 isoform X1 [Drosophila grimshawi]EDV99918.1 GH12134 [Drosophila grimshawi]